MTALCDVAVVATLGYGATVANDLANHGVLRATGPALELAGMFAALFLFVNLMSGRYQISHYLSTRGQVTAAFAAWNITLVAFLVLLFLAKIADHYSRLAILATYLAGIPAIALCRSAIVHLIASGSRTGKITSERVFLIGREKDVMSFVESSSPGMPAAPSSTSPSCTRHHRIATPAPLSLPIWPRLPPVAGPSGRTPSSSPCPGRSTRPSKPASMPS